VILFWGMIIGYRFSEILGGACLHGLCLFVALFVAVS